MAEDPELFGLREVYDALKERRTALAIETGRVRLAHRNRGDFQPTIGWENAEQIIEMEKQMNAIHSIIEARRGSS